MQFLHKTNQDEFYELCICIASNLCAQLHINLYTHTHFERFGQYYTRYITRYHGSDSSVQHVARHLFVEVTGHVFVCFSPYFRYLNWTIIEDRPTLCQVTLQSRFHCTMYYEFLQTSSINKMTTTVNLWQGENIHLEMFLSDFTHLWIIWGLIFILMAENLVRLSLGLAVTCLSGNCIDRSWLFT